MADLFYIDHLPDGETEDNIRNKLVQDYEEIHDVQCISNAMDKDAPPQSIGFVKLTPKGTGESKRPETPIEEIFKKMVELFEPLMALVKSLIDSAKLVLGPKEVEEHKLPVTPIEKIFEKTAKSPEALLTLAKSLREILAIEFAQAVLESVLETGPLTDVRKMSVELADEREFSPARKLLEQAGKKYPDEIWIPQKRALYTYKDEGLPSRRRYMDALEILEGIGLRESQSADPETLRLGGAIYKRLWEFEGQLEYLHEALTLYQTAFERDGENDYGYGGINAAYILQILAHRARITELRNKTSLNEARKLEEQADIIRSTIVDQLTKRSQQEPKFKNDYFYLVTLAEAYFGLGQYDGAGRWLEGARSLEPSEWQCQTTVRQLVSIARMQGIAPPHRKRRPGRLVSGLAGH